MKKKVGRPPVADIDRRVPVTIMVPNRHRDELMALFRALVKKKTAKGNA